MDIKTFLTNLDLFYPYKGDLNKKGFVFNTYIENLEGIALTNKCEYDWKKVLLAIQRGYKKTTFPLLADIINYMPEGKIEKEYKPFKDEGSLVVITLPNGTTYPFTVARNGRQDKIIIDEIKKKFGNCDIKTFPSTYQFMGTKAVEF